MRVLALVAGFLAAGLLVLATFSTAEARTCRVHGKKAPDLVILTEGTYLKFTGKCSLVRSVVKGRVAIRNVGEAPAKLLVASPLIKVFDATRRNMKDADRKLNRLQPRETQTTRVAIGRLQSKKGYKGLRRFIVMADPFRKIEECNERNNTQYVWVRVNCK